MAKHILVEDVRAIKAHEINTVKSFDYWCTIFDAAILKAASTATSVTVPLHPLPPEELIQKLLTEYAEFYPIYNEIAKHCKFFW